MYMITVMAIATSARPFAEATDDAQEAFESGYTCYRRTFVGNVCRWSLESDWDIGDICQDIIKVVIDNGLEISNLTIVSAVKK